MINPIFVKVRNDEGKIYDSYDDFWSLVKLSGFKSCELDDVKPESQRVYVFTPDNGNVKACCEREHRATYILWQLERPGKVENKVPEHFDRMWVSDRYFEQLVNNDRVKYVPIGGHPDFGEWSYDYEPKKYDFAHISYAYGRRLALMEALESEGYSLAPAGWGEKRDESLKESRNMLCLHQDDMPVIEPLRYTIAACYGLPIVAEESRDFYPYFVQVLGKPGGKSKLDIAKMNYELMTQRLTFRRCVQEALNG